MQMKVKTLAIEAAAKMLLPNSQLWLHAKKLVSDINNNAELTGDEKRYVVRADLKALFNDLTSAIIDLAIVLAVNWARAQ